MPGKQSVALKNVVGIDHVVLMVKELDKAAENWKRLGFTVSPRGTHSAHMGSGNYTIMFDPDYMELLGVLTETEHNAPARASPRDSASGLIWPPVLFQNPPNQASEPSMSLTCSRDSSSTAAPNFDHCRTRRSAILMRPGECTGCTHPVCSCSASIP